MKTYFGGQIHKPYQGTGILHVSCNAAGNDWMRHFYDHISYDFRVNTGLDARLRQRVTECLYVGVSRKELCAQEGFPVGLQELQGEMSIDETVIEDLDRLLVREEFLSRE